MIHWALMYQGGLITLTPKLNLCQWLMVQLWEFNGQVAECIEVTMI
jgi:hypothetical protein